MSGGQTIKPSVRVLLALNICICGYVLLHSLFSSFDLFEQREIKSLAESRGESAASDSHTHEDDLSSLDTVHPNRSMLKTPKEWGVRLFILSHTPLPSVPPPKNN
jgi:hypothetical protein